MNKQCTHQNYTSKSYGPLKPEEEGDDLAFVCRCDDCGEYFIISNETYVDNPESTS